MENENEYLAFIGNQLVIRGNLAEVVIHCKKQRETGASERVAIFNDSTGQVRDYDTSGTESEVLSRLRLPEKSAPAKGPGRPKLGVVSREVGLLPRHWQWLSEQRGGASAALRRLVEHARKHESGQSIARRAVDAAHRFMWDIAGDQPNFEQATRHLFAFQLDAFSDCIKEWPSDIVEQLHRYRDRAALGLAQDSENTS